MCYTYIKMKIKTKSKKQIKPIYLNKLTKTEFFDVYGISLLHPQVTLSNAYLLSLLLPLAQKYYNITYHAITAELRYFLRGCVSNFYNEFTIEVSPTNRGLLKKLKITDFKNQRKKLKLAQIFQLFHCGDWVKNIYGGEAWAKITKACDDLKAAMATKNIPIICMAIDRLNDLEHNANLYLAQYSTFSLEDALDFKSEALEDEIINKCSDGIRELTKFKRP